MNRFRLNLSTCTTPPESGNGIVEEPATRHDRYPGPPPFQDTPQDRCIFFGRDVEIDSVKKRIIATRIVVLFGKSGLGKTSLLQAGLFPELRREGYLPIVVRLMAEKPLIELVDKAAQKTCDDFHFDYVPGERGSLWEYFKTSMFWSGDTLLVPVLIFDQFEEIFNLSDAAFRGAFAKELGPVVSGHPPEAVLARMKEAAGAARIGEAPPKVKIMISLREEYLGAMEELSHGIPGLFQERVRLLPLDEVQAAKAIREPASLKAESTPSGTECRFDSPPFAYEPAALEAMLSFLKGRTDTIEPFQIQLLCQHVEQLVREHKIRPDSSGMIKITANDIGDPDEMRKVLETFYAKAVAELSWRTKRRVRQLCEVGLLDAAGRRLSLEQNQIRDEFRVSDETIEILLKKRLLREEPRLESRFYEISHDTLAQSIVQIRGWRIPKKYKLAALVGVVALAVVVSVGVLYVRSVTAAKDKESRLRKDAVLAQGKAEEARAKAEDLVGFLIGEDLMKKIRPIGQLGIMEQIQQKVNGYLNSVADEGTSPSSIRNRGLARINQGNLYYSRGKLQDAKKEYKEARQDFRLLAERDPNNVEWQANLARATAKLGVIAADQFHLVDASSLYRKALAIRKRLADNNAKQESLLRDVASSYDDVGDILRMQGCISEALDYYRNTIRIAEPHDRPSEDAKEWLYMLQEGYDGLGAIHGARGNAQASREAYELYLGKALKAARISPYEPEAQYRLGLAIYRLATQNITTRPGDVLDQYGRLHKIIEDMTEWDPSNAYWQRELAAVTAIIGEAHRLRGDRGDREAALDSYKKALAILKERVDIDATNASWRSDLAWFHIDIGDALAGYQNVEALSHYESASQILRPLVAVDSDNVNIDAHSSLVGLYIRKANLLRSEKQIDAALEAYRQALEMMKSRKVTDSTDVRTLDSMQWLLREMGVALSKKGDVSGAVDAYVQSEQTLRKAITMSEGNASYWNQLFLLLHANVAPLRTEQEDRPGALAAYREAVAAVEKAVALEPNVAAYRQNLGVAHRKVGDGIRQDKPEEALAAYQKSEEALRQAIKLKEYDADGWNRLYHLFSYSVAPLRAEQKDQAGALEAHRAALVAAEKAVALEPNKAVYHQNVGLAHQRVGDRIRHSKPAEARAEYGKAEEALRQAIQLSLDDKEDRADNWNRLYYLFSSSVGPLRTEQKDQSGALDAYREALKAAQQAVAVDPNEVVYRRNVSVAYQRAGDCIRQSKPAEARAKYREAEDTLRQAIQLSGDDKTDSANNWNALFLLLYESVGPLHTEQEDQAGALETYREALAAAAKAVVLEPNEAVYHQSLGLVYRRVGDHIRQDKPVEALTAYRKSEEALRRAIQLKGDDAGNYNHLSLLLSGSVARLRREQEDDAGALDAYREALTAMEKAVALGPNEAVYWNNLGVAYRRVGDANRQDRPDEALAAYKKSEGALRQATKLRKDNASYWNQLSLLLSYSVAGLREQQEDQAGALKAYRQALVAAEEAVASEPNKAVFRQNLGVTYEQVGDLLRQARPKEALAAYRASEEALRQATRLEESSAGYWNQLYLLLYDRVAPLREGQEDPAGALEAYRAALASVEKAVALEPKKAIYRENLGVAHRRVGDRIRQVKPEEAVAAYKESEAALRQAVKLEEDNAGHWNQLSLLLSDSVAWLREKQKDRAGALAAYREALVAAEKAAALEPKEAVYQQNLGLTHKQVGDLLRPTRPKEALAAYREAENTLRQAVKLKEDNASCWNQLFLVLCDKVAPLCEEQKDRAGALEAYRQALAAVEKAVALEPNETVYRQNRDVVQDRLKSTRGGRAKK